VTDDAFDLELATVTILGDTHDVRTLLKVLVGQLAGALGDRLKVEKAGGLLHRSDEIRSLSALIGNDEYRADVSGASVTCTVGHASGGIRIRSEKVEMDEWLRRLLRSLQAEAEHSQAARLALENIVIGGTA
jgi:hypothetical protein